MKTGRIFNTLFLTALGFGAGFAFKAWMDRSPARKTAERKILYWHDPMHPAYRSDKPGTAPDCGMKLVPVYAEADPVPPAGAHANAAVGKILYYRDPRQPGYRAPNPGLNPETGNELIPVREGDAETLAAGSVQIGVGQRQLLNVRFGTAEFTSDAKTVRAAGRVMLDETRVAHVHTRVEGWIDKVFADFNGKLVQKGQPLFTVYSPEMLATQQEFLLAMKARTQLGKSTVDGVPGNMSQLVEAARRRLELWDLSPEQIDEVARTGKPLRSITVFSPVSGYVTERKAFPNLQVKPDTDLYTIVDLDRVWIVADVFEADAASARVGVPATVRLSTGTGRSYRTRVSYIQPQLDPVTRTLKVRLELDNPGHSLKPEMYVDVEFTSKSSPRLTVPVEAVLDSGERRTVFVDRGNGYLEPRQVETGERADDRVEILKGLKAGDRIVVSGNFLIDSESQLKAAAAGMAASNREAAGSPSPAPAPPAPAPRHKHD